MERSRRPHDHLATCAFLSGPATLPGIWRARSIGPYIDTFRVGSTDEGLSGVQRWGRRAIVTGATSVIGIETARALARAHAEIIRLSMFATRAWMARQTIAPGLVAVLKLVAVALVRTVAGVFRGGLASLGN